MATAAKTGTDDGCFVGGRVAAIRKRRGMTQQMLADLTGKSRGAIAKYENGERPVDSRDTLHALAKALQCDVRDLTGHEQDRFDPRTAEFHATVPTSRSPCGPPVTRHRQDLSGASTNSG
ncbi:helix-turn-helix domain-containing protein [Nocardia sp. NPDC101769]|uniref:helix-turn-helix domain-containing protein n=1 Tax=Nocardia sp. NPDC101769 TaxID=3364333 RepID=UPI003810520C